jgi:hypothetical protein
MVSPDTGPLSDKAASAPANWVIAVPVSPVVSLPDPGPNPTLDFW